jgi:trk system potassium uptake protein TrkA
MYIVVVGGGMVGGRLARRLSQGKHDVVLIDPHEDICKKVYAETGVVAIQGNGSNIEVLKESGVEKADVVVAATGEDADNLLVAILAKSLDVPQIIVRMRNPDYENAYRVAGANVIVRVIDLMVNQIVMEIEHPAVRRITTIGGGRANIFMVVVPKGANVVGRSVVSIAQSQEFPPECTFVAVYNQQTEEFSIPRGGQVINEGDELFVISRPESIKKVVDFIIAKTFRPS